MNLRGRSFLTLLDYSPEEIRFLLDLSHELKREKRERVFPERLKHKNIVLIFDKTSTHTRCAFEVAALDEVAGLLGDIRSAWVEIRKAGEPGAQP